MNPAVQGDVLGDHLFKLIHDSLDGFSCCYGFVLIPCNSNLILWRNSSKFNTIKKTLYIYGKKTTYSPIIISMIVTNTVIFNECSDTVMS